MNATDFPLSKYLERIGLGKIPDTNEEGLKEVHACQAFGIPFENLDIHLGRSISLKSADLINKLIYRRRGGYCFELNGLFSLALKSLGFNVKAHLARVHYRRTDAGARTHQVLVVTISGRNWLADCGFGGPGLRHPMPIVPNRVEEQYEDIYRLQRISKYGLMLQKKGDNTFVDLYAFNEEEMTLSIDIEMANHFTSTWPDSIFRLHRMCSMPKPWGRITLSDMDLTIYRNGQSIHHVLPPGPAYMAAIVEHFGINPEAAYEDFVPLLY